MSLKIKTKKFNRIIKITDKIKELNKKGEFEIVKKLIHTNNWENWSNFLKLLQELKVKNNLKEYFLRLRFYTNITNNIDILKELKKIINI